jgi:hypothetical protein
MLTLKFNILILIIWAYTTKGAPNTEIMIDSTRDTTKTVNNIESAPSKAYECLIKNGKYIFDYLYASKQKDSFFINKKTKDNILNRFSNNRQVLIFPFTMINNYEKIKWKLIPVKNVNLKYSNQTYFIKNQLYMDEYLCAAKLHVNILFKTRRKVYTQRFNHSITDLNHNGTKHYECMWRFIKTGFHLNEFELWNVMYDEPLYAASAFFSTSELGNLIHSCFISFPYFMYSDIIKKGKSVYTWHSEPDTDQFNWHVNCKISKE